MIAEWLKDNQDGGWNCKSCRENHLYEGRNCNNEYPGAFRGVRLFDKTFMQCPLSVIDDSEIWDVLHIVNICEGGGMGGSRVMASALVEEPNAYFELSNIILAEKNRIERIRKQQEDKKKQRG